MRNSLLVCALALAALALTQAGAIALRTGRGHITATILHRTDCPQSWYELPAIRSVETHRLGTVDIKLIDTASLFGKVQSRLLGVDTNHTVLVDESGEIAAVEGLLSPTEIRDLVDYLDENRFTVPHLRERVRADPRNLDALWALYYGEDSVGGDAASDLLARLVILDPRLESAGAERYKISQFLNTIEASDVVAITECRDRLAELASSIKTPEGLRAISGPLAMSNHRLGDQAAASEWLRVRWHSRLPWEGRSAARRFLQNVVGDDAESFDKALVGELREFAGLGERLPEVQSTTN